jgi:hypothetical protein
MLHSLPESWLLTFLEDSIKLQPLGPSPPSDKQSYFIMEWAHGPTEVKFKQGVLPPWPSHVCGVTISELWTPEPSYFWQVHMATKQLINLHMNTVNHPDGWAKGCQGTSRAALWSALSRQTSGLGITVTVRRSVTSFPSSPASWKPCGCQLSTPFTTLRQMYMERKN